MNQFVINMVLFIGYLVPVVGQSDFDKKTDSLFFHLPRLASIEEIDYNLHADSVFFDIKYPLQRPHNMSIQARFVQNPFLHFMPDTSNFYFGISDSVRFFFVREMSFYYSDHDEEKALNQVKELFDYFEKVAFFWEELPDHDKYQGESYAFYGDKKSFSKKLPRVNVHSNYFPPKYSKDGHYLISVFLTEEKN